MKFLKKIVSAAITVIMVLSALNILASADSSKAEYKAEVGKLLNTEERIESVIRVETDGEYELIISFDTVSDSTREIEYAVKVDGKYPFEDAKELEAPVIYEDVGNVRTLSNGDQTAPPQKSIDGYMTSAAYDKTGVKLRPYTVNVTAGEHTVEIENLGDAFILAGITLSAPEVIKPYSEISKEYKGYKKYDGKQIVIEAENVLCRNDYSITAKSDTGSADITPKSATNSIINYIGGSNWSSPF